MKKTFAVALALLLALSLFGCSFLPSFLTGSSVKDEPVAEITEEPVQTPFEVPTEVPTEAPTEAPAEPEPFGPKDLIGVWTVTTANLEGMSVKSADLGLEAYFDFLEDGKNVRCWMRSSGEVDEYTMAYDIDGYSITFHDRVSDEYGVYIPETDIISITSGDVEMLIERTPDAKIPDDDEPVVTAAPVVDDTNPIVGTWKLTSGVASGITVSASQLGMEMAFRFDADGSAAMIYDGQTTSGLSWRLEGSVVKLSAYGTDLYDFAYDGTSLTVEESGVLLIFTK